MSNISSYSDKRSNFVSCCYKKKILRIQIYFQEVTIYSVNLNTLPFLIYAIYFRVTKNAIF